ncbi:MAG: response regulator [Proteobacteria bacterium]|nr:response regulator [Pseudomonadota bacterium]
MRIRTKIGLIVSAVAAGSFLTAWLIGAFVSSRLTLDRLSQEHERQVQALGVLAENAYAKKGDALLEPYLASIPLVVPGVEYAYVESADGRILLHSDRSAAGKIAGEWRSAHPQVAEYSADVRAPGQGIAKARVGVRNDLGETLKRELRRSLLPANLLFGALGVLASLVAGLGVAFLLADPVLRLAEGASEVSRGNLSLRLPVESADEVGELTRQFNSMVERLAEVDELKDRFVQDVSHDLRSPLAAVKMSLDFLLNDDRDRDKILPSHRQTLATAVENVTRLGVFVSNILDAAKMKAGRMEVRAEPVPLQRVAKALSELYSVVAESRGVAFSAEVPDAMPPVLADPERLERALANLLSNALKFTPSGGRVSLRGSAAGGTAEIVVEDTGQGIPKDALPRLFSRFEQAHAGGARGTGLGLFIVKETVEAMGGTVGVESEEGKGTRAVIRLPAAAGGAAPAPVAAPRGSASAKVLVVDDDYSFARMTQRMLESMGYASTSVHDGRAAVEAAVRERPDLILMDMDLGVLRAADALKALGDNEETVEIPVLLCSAVKDDAEVKRALNSGAASFLAKPLRAGELDAEIRRILALRSGR